MNLAASELGFGAEAEMRDRTQMLFIAHLSRQGAHRFILKGGMAMRALYGSTRLSRSCTVVDQSGSTRISGTETLRSDVKDRQDRLPRQLGVIALYRTRCARKY